MGDPVKNFAKCIVSGTYSSSDTAITLQAGEGAKLPAPAIDGAFNLVWWNYTDYPDPSGDPNSEIVRCTARTVDALTVTRNQESSGATAKNIAGKTYVMSLSFTKKTYDDKIDKSLYDANTVLYATTDNTPVALTVGEQTVVGRITGGNITALTATQLATLALSSALAENTAIILDASLSADGKYSGIVETGTAGATLAFGDLCYFQASDSRWELVDANLSAGYDKKLGMCVQAANADGDATTILLIGKIRADAVFPTFTIGSPVYMGETAGDVVVTQPSTADVCIRIVGFGNTADELWFNPSNDYIIHT